MVNKINFHSFWCGRFHFFTSMDSLSQCLPVTLWVRNRTNLFSHLLKKKKNIMKYIKLVAVTAFQILLLWFVELKFPCFINTNLSFQVSLGFECMEYSVFWD